MNPAAKGLLEALDGLEKPCGTPWDRLRLKLEQHAETEFGKAHGFSEIRMPKKFREAVPMRDYEGHRPWIDRVAAGEKEVLACGEVLAFERTSGTSAGAKLIPVTAGLRQEFAPGMAGWFSGWKKRCPEVFSGPAYWSISPPGCAVSRTTGGLPIGLESDAAWFPEKIGARLSEWLVIPGLGDEPGEVFAETAEALLHAPELSLVSVWSPTFLLGIDSHLRRLRPGKTWEEIFPKLALASCWADASSAAWIPELQRRLGGVALEPKGLLSTEGVTSFPNGPTGEPRLARECHYHEFLDDSGNFVEENDLQIGRIYEVLLTTAGGLFRYRSGDRVKITGPNAQMRFVGRAGSVSDLVGEKLSEEMVSHALQKTATHGFLTPDPNLPGYHLWLENPKAAPQITATLRQNPWFARALDLNQLAPLQSHPLPENWPVKLTTALAAKQSCRLGDIKIPAILIQTLPSEIEKWLA